MVGANDATHATPWLAFAEQTRAAAGSGRRRVGDAVVLGSTPRFYGTEIIPQPLRFMVDSYAGVLRGEQRAAVAATPGTRLADLALVAPRFEGVPEATSRDGFHPSPIGYGFWADALAAELAVVALAGRRLRHAAQPALGGSGGAKPHHLQVREGCDQSRIVAAAAGVGADRPPDDRVAAEQLRRAFAVAGPQLRPAHDAREAAGHDPPRDHGPREVEPHERVGACPDEVADARVVAVEHPRIRCGGSRHPLTEDLVVRLDPAGLPVERVQLDAGQREARRQRPREGGLASAGCADHVDPTSGHQSRDGRKVSSQAAWTPITTTG